MKAQEIRALRERLQLTQEVFARILGVSFATVNRWENGKSEPSGDYARVLQTLQQLTTSDSPGVKIICFGCGLKMGSRPSGSCGLTSDSQRSFRKLSADGRPALAKSHRPAFKSMCPSHKPAHQPPAELSHSTRLAWSSMAAMSIGGRSFVRSTLRNAADDKAASTPPSHASPSITSSVLSSVIRQS